MPAKAGIQLCRATWNLKPTYNSFGVDNNRKTVRLSGFMGHGSQVDEWLAGTTAEVLTTLTSIA